MELCGTSATRTFQIWATGLLTLLLFGSGCIGPSSNFAPWCPPGAPCSISYAQSSGVYVVNTPLSIGGPTVNGGTPTSYSIQPATLPAGLFFHPSDGSISGTPTVLTPATTYAVTGGNSAGSSSTSLTVAVVNFSKTFNLSHQINTQIDMLWVVDNSPSMDVSQKALRNGFASFATQYMKPQWDIRIAAITSDTYLANQQFISYLAESAGLYGFQSKYLNHQSVIPFSGSTDSVAGRVGNFVNPSYPGWPASGIDPSTGTFTFSPTINNIWPAYGPNWGVLAPAGQHDGPLASLCFEANTYFFFGEALCYIRDTSPNIGPSHCTAPSGNDQFGNPEDSTTQCVNTFMNDTVHSGSPILSTISPTGTTANSAWSNALVNSFLTNVSTGSDGSGSERGMSSVLELMQDNETAATRKANASPLFREGSIRVIVFVSDEDDQSISLNASDPLDPAPITNPSSVFTGYIYTDTSAQRETNCPVTPGNPQTANCCAVKTVSDTTGTYSYIIPVCPKGYPAAANNTASAVLMPVADVKTKFDNFFTTLDGTNGSPGANPNYMVASIVVTTAAGVQSLHQSQRCPEQLKIFGVCNEFYDVTSDRGDRYIELADLVGNNSGSFDITSGDYSPILSTIGQAMIQRRFSFILPSQPSNGQAPAVTIVHADGTSYLVSPPDYTITGNVISLDSDVIFGTNGYPGLAETDAISIAD